MSKKKKISNQNYMDFIVVKNPEIEYETNDKGQVTVMSENRTSALTGSAVTVSKNGKTTCPSDPVSGVFKGSSSDRAKGGLLICLFFNIFPLFYYSPLPPLLFTAGDSGAVRDSSRTYLTCSFQRASPEFRKF